MNADAKNAQPPDETRWRRAQAWNDFWFTPRDPTIMGLMRVFCGAITLYTLFAYSFMLQDFMGEHAWYDLALRREVVDDRANPADPLDGRWYSRPTPSNKFEEDYHKNYYHTFNKNHPPAPYPRNEKEALYLNKYRAENGVDLRTFGLRPPVTTKEFAYVEEYTNHWSNLLRLPPPAYPETAEEKEAIFDYMIRHEGHDPRRLYARGQPAWSIWFHVTDPAMMALVHGLILFVTFLFTIGFCTRITSVLTWMTSLWYIHRNPAALFGVDTMMVIMLTYLMIGSSGAAFSVDRLIARWWSKAKPRVVNRWRSLFGKPALDAAAIRPAVYSQVPVATVSTNVALRMLQIHVCIIYLISGLSKLLGQAWWQGNAVWRTLANFEFAPMAFEINGADVYNDILRALAGNQLVYETLLTVASYGTLAFEIGYMFLVWRPGTRWVILSGAIMLHGFIGLFMGLKTFSLMMLVMNMAFVRTEEAQRVFGLLGRLFGSADATPAKTTRPAKPEPVPAFTPGVGEPSSVSTHVKQKK